MFIEAVIIGFLIAIFSGGRIDNLNYIEIKAWYLIIVGMLLQLIPVFISGYSFLTYVQLVGILLIFIAVVINIKVKGFWIILLGGIVNLVAILINGLKMPVHLIFNEGNKLNGFIDTIIEGDVINYFISTSNSLSVLIGKILATPDWYPFFRLLSIGDIIISIGIIVFIYGELCRKNYRRKSTMIKYTYKQRS